MRHRLSEQTALRVSPALDEALDRAVKASGELSPITRSDYIRAALEARLRADGFVGEPRRAP
jgi:predicted DNA-binding protein